MSIDRTLHIKSGVGSKRNVLKRPERIALMTENGLFDPAVDSAIGLVKTRIKHSKAGGKSKKEEKPAEQAAAAEAGEGEENAES